MTGKLKNDMTGTRHKRLLVTGYAGAGRWNCLCDCGTEKVVAGGRLRDGSTKSCGCFQRSSEANESRGRVRHGIHGTSTYNIWALMIQRCENPNASGYELYGGAGIAVCERWHDCALFVEDMGMRPSSSHSIERVDGTRGYEPGNCVWATAKEQTRNTSRNLNFTIGGKTQCLLDWCGGDLKFYNRVRYRLKQGMHVERALKECEVAA